MDKVYTELIRRALKIHIADLDRKINACNTCPITCPSEYEEQVGLGQVPVDAGPVWKPRYQRPYGIRPTQRILGEEGLRRSAPIHHPEGTTETPIRTAGPFTGGGRVGDDSKAPEDTDAEYGRFDADGFAIPAKRQIGTVPESERAATLVSTLSMGSAVQNLNFQGNLTSPIPRPPPGTPIPSATDGLLLTTPATTTTNVVVGGDQHGGRAEGEGVTR